ncbi:MAG TPA: universal stress protein [Blastocatellia bacterium]|nr:universal stress protein [Blastocatellia bacterium]
MKILLATDGSDCSKAAVDAVAGRPWPEGSEVKVLSATELPYMPTTETWVFPDSYFKDLEAAGKEQAETAVSQAVERLKSVGNGNLKVSAEITTGSAKDVILDVAEHWGADLIVLGSHGYSGWRRFLLGSVSQAVATHAHCSIEIVRRKKEGA